MSDWDNYHIFESAATLLQVRVEPLQKMTLQRDDSMKEAQSAGTRKTKMREKQWKI